MKVETYHGHDIYSHGTLSEAICYKMDFSVCKDSKLRFKISCLIDHEELKRRGKFVTEPSEFYKGGSNILLQTKQNAQDLLCDEGLKQVHGKIDLERFEEGKTCEEYWIESKKASDSLSDKEICDELLKALYRIRMWCPPLTFRDETERIDVDGFCNVLDISRKRYKLNADYLAGGGLIEAPSIPSGHIYITNNGIDKVELEMNKPRMGFGP